MNVCFKRSFPYADIKEQNRVVYIYIIKQNENTGKIKEICIIY